MILQGTRRIGCGPGHAFRHTRDCGKREVGVGGGVGLQRVYLQHGFESYKLHALLQLVSTAVHPPVSFHTAATHRIIVNGGKGHVISVASRAVPRIVCIGMCVCERTNGKRYLQAQALGVSWPSSKKVTNLNAFVVRGLSQLRRSEICFACHAREGMSLSWQPDNRRALFCGGILPRGNLDRVITNA